MKRVVTGMVLICAVCVSLSAVTTVLPTISGFTALGVYNGHRYYKSELGYSWHQAKALCEQHGGHLATISNAAEDAYLHQFTETYADANGWNYYWIGFTDELQEGVWRWVTGEPVTYVNWQPGEPNNTNGMEHYATNRWSFNASWNDLADVLTGPWQGYYCHALLEIDSAYDVPLDISINGLGADLNLTWSQCPGAQGYNVYYNTDPYANDWSSNFHYTEDNSWQLNGLEGSNWFFKITAVYP